MLEKQKQRLNWCTSEKKYLKNRKKQWQRDVATRYCGGTRYKMS